MKKKIYILIAVPHLIDVNWLIGLLLCKVTRKKKSAVKKWVTLTTGKIIRKSIEKFG